jgi:hypothetical protein
MAQKNRTNQFGIPDDPVFATPDAGPDLTHGNQTIQFGILDGLIFATPDTVHAFLVLSHENVDGGLWTLLRLAPLILLPLTTF